MRMPDTAEPWTDAEVDWLDELLLREDIGLDNPLFATEIDGFLCALISGPQLIMPTEALRWIFDGEAGEQAPQFSSDGEGQRFVQLVMKQWNYIAASLMQGSYEPLLMLNHGEDGREVTQFSDWCVGYMTGVERDREGWSAMLDDNGQELLGTMMLYGTPEGWDAVDRAPALSDDEHEALGDSLGERACAIHRYWLERRAAPVRPARRTSAKVGRNDACHCGSGRKFKHCHGAN